MTAREIDDAATNLRELRVASVSQLALASVAFGLALAATQLRPSLTVPLLVGAMVVTGLGLRALVRRWLLVEDLASEGDAYAIADVRRFGARATSPERRLVVAQALRVSDPDLELRRLIMLLEQKECPLEPQAVVSLERWLHDPLPADELRRRARALLTRAEP